MKEDDTYDDYEIIVAYFYPLLDAATMVIHSQTNRTLRISTRHLETVVAKIEYQLALVLGFESASQMKEAQKMAEMADTEGGKK